MNKKILIVFIPLLLAPLVFAPLTTGAPRKKQYVNIAAYNVQLLNGNPKFIHLGFDISVGGSYPLHLLLPKILLPHRGTADILIVPKLDPETGFGTVQVEGVLDFGELGYFEIHGNGKCGGMIQPDPHVPPRPVMYCQGEILGHGRGDLQGTFLNLIWSYGMRFPWWFPAGVEDQEGLIMVGEISW